jgi:DNA-binding Lrp family transcriptional regulator
VKRLEAEGVIQEYTVELSQAMLDTEGLDIEIHTDGSEKIEELINQIGTHRMIGTVYREQNRKYVAGAWVAGTTEFFELKGFLESLDSVTRVELHPVVNVYSETPPHSKLRSRGKKVSFSKNQLQVLKCLSENVRMPISEIAKRINLTPRRVGRILRELEEGGGVHFTIRINWFALGEIILEYYIQYDETKTSVEEIVSWFKEHYPLEFWGAGKRLDEPVITVDIIVEDQKKVGDITKMVREATFVKCVDDVVLTPQTFVKVRYRDPSQHRLEELFREAGL